MRRTCPLLVAVAVLGGACKDKTKPFQYDRASRDEVEATARKLERALTACTKSALAEVIDVEGMMRLAAQGTRKEVREAIIDSVSKLDVRNFCSGGTKLASFKYLRSRGSGEGHDIALFRGINADSSFDYSEVFIGKRNGRAVAFDFRAFSDGRRRTRIASDMMKVLQDYPIGTPQQIMELSALIKKGKHKAAQQILVTLPEALRRTEAVMLFEVAITADLDEKQYAAALNKFRKAFPNNPSIDMQEIDRAFMAKRYKDALAAVDRLDKRVGGDPYLNVVRANITALLGDDAVTAKHLRRARAANPAFLTKDLKEWLDKHEAEAKAKQSSSTGIKKITGNPAPPPKATAVRPQP